MSELSDIYYLNLLIDALDRRGPQPARADAEEIARAAAALRRRAVRRLAELSGAPRSAGSPH
jgi:hypothetical protein